MKILHVGPKNFPPSHGGTERVVFDIVNGLKDFESYVLVEFEQKETDYIRVLPKGYMNRLSFILNFVKEKGIDLVHFHNETYIPMAILYSLRSRRNILTIHGLHFTNPKYNIFQRVFILLFDILGAIFLPNLVFCSDFDRKLFNKYIPFRKLHYVPNGINAGNIAFNKDAQLTKTLVYLGRISPEKNLVSLIDNVDKAQIPLHIYGNFDSRRPLFNQSIKTALAQSNYAKWMGSVAYSDVYKTLSKYKTFVYPSLSEGMPLAVIEAAYCGLFLVLSDIPQHTLLNFPDTIFLNPHDFSLDKQMLVGNGMRNKEYVEMNYTLEIMLKGYRSLYTLIN